MITSHAHTRMSASSNVIDFARRAALMRGRRDGFALAQLDGPMLKSIFDTEYFDCTVNAAGHCIVHDDLTVGICAEPRNFLLNLFSYFRTSGTREQALDFCIRFNLQLIVVSAQALENADENGAWPVQFDYERFCFGEERVEAKAVMRSVRLFQKIVRDGIGRLDEQRIFGESCRTTSFTRWPAPRLRHP